MQSRRHEERCERWRGARAGALAFVVLAMVSPAAADERASRACRGRLGVEVAKLIRLGLKQVDRCRQVQNRVPAPGGPCNVVGSPEFDPKGRYAAARGRARTKLSSKCRAGDPVLANYPGGDLGAVLDAVDASVGGNSALVQGNASLDGDKAKARCIRGIGRARAKIFASIVTASTACQRKRDRRATAFGPIDEACVGAGGPAVQKANAAIQKACGSQTGLGTCTPLPDCAAAAARTAAQGVVRDAYSLLAGRPTCGDGAVAFPEQCDDGNTADGDGCSAGCDLEGGSCTGPIGSRTVRIEVTTPTPLSALRIDLEYPQFESGLPGTGQSGIVAARVALLQGTAAGVASVTNDRDSDVTIVLGGPSASITSGALLDVSLEACVALAENICNRNQNIFGCCPSGDVANCFATPTPCTTFDTQTLTRGDPPGCCPADNACTTQALATTCSVTDPVGEGGATVEGVTCTVTITGT